MIGFVVLKAAATRSSEIIVSELIRRIRDEIGAVACFRSAAVLKRLPKTRSGKILRGTMRKIAEGAAVTLPATIDDPAILDEVRDALRALGYPPPPSLTGSVWLGRTQLPKSRAPGSVAT